MMYISHLQILVHYCGNNHSIFNIVKIANDVCQLQNVIFFVLMPQKTEQILIETLSMKLALSHQLEADYYYRTPRRKIAKQSDDSDIHIRNFYCPIDDKLCHQLTWQSINKKSIKLNIVMFRAFSSLFQARKAITKTLYYLSSHRYNPQTVYALSSGVNSAISIVRISGSESYKVLSLLKHHYDCNGPKELLLSNLNVKPRMMMLRSLYSKQRGLIDKGLMVYFEASNSYSGEDLFELHLHGSRAVVSAIFHQLSKLRFKPAKRGQFTRRALLNGRMSLLEAEAINDLIHSQLEFQRQIAMNNLLGKGSKYLQSLRKDLTVVKCLIESYIQFQEQEVGKGLYENAKEKSRIILHSLRQVIESSKKLQNAKEGIRVSIVGRPNVGKSTLINNLVKKDIAIVSNIPGTTRDLIESSFQLRGYKVEVVDTAGIRDSSCQIQKQGIRRSKKSMQESHFSIIVFDVSQSVLKEAQDKLVIVPNDDQLKMLNMEKKLVIVNKIDILPPNHKNRQITIELLDGSLLIPSLAISANTEEGTLQLTEFLSKIIEKKYNLYSNDGSQIYFTRDRYLKSLEQCALNLQNLLQQPYADMGGHFIDRAIHSVEEIIGKIDNEQILDQIFSTFCIGK